MAMTVSAGRFVKFTGNGLVIYFASNHAGEVGDIPDAGVSTYESCRLSARSIDGHHVDGHGRNHSTVGRFRFLND
jgi:hypothetical protein